MGSNSDLNAVNIITDPNNEEYLEINLCGSDVNPFLVLTAIMHSINYSLKSNVTPDEIIKKIEKENLPFNLNIANKIFNKSDATKGILSEVIHHHLNAFYSYEYQVYIKFNLAIYEPSRCLGNQQILLQHMRTIELIINIFN